MSLANYADLQSAVSSWVNRSDITSSQLQDFIRIAESEINSRVRVRNNMTTATLSLTAGNNYVSLPSDFLEEVELNYAASTDSLVRAPYQDIDLARGDTTARKPSLYAINGGQINFDSASDATYSLTLRYFEKWDIATDSTNWLLTNHPDVYLFGTLAEVNQWLGDEAAARFALTRRDAAIDRVLAADGRGRGSVLRVDAALAVAGRYNILTDR
jgi:hypothetical protein